MPQDESEKYLSLLKKGLSGGLGRNLIDIVFSTAQVMDSDEHRLLTALRDSELKDAEARNRFYQTVIDSLEMEDCNYLILLACDVYDVPHRSKDDELQPDASDEVFRYILCSICPVKDGKPELGFFSGDNEFHSCMASQIVSQPELGFLFPAFDDRTANIYNALLYTRTPDQVHHEFIAAVFHTEPLTVSVQEVAAILKDCGVADTQVAAFEAQCGAQFGDGAVLNPENIIDSKHFEVKTADASVAIDPKHSYIVETRIIDGRKYLLIPADEGVEVNGMAVGIAAADRRA